MEETKTPRTDDLDRKLKGEWSMCYGAMLQHARGLEMQLLETLAASALLDPKLTELEARLSKEQELHLKTMADYQDALNELNVIHAAQGGKSEQASVVYAHETSGGTTKL
jgi:hypothetical protein